MPLPPPGRLEQAQQTAALAASTPRIATVAPVIVPRRTSSAIAATTSPPDDRRDERRVSGVRGVRERRCSAARTGRGTRRRRRRPRARRRAPAGSARAAVEANAIARSRALHRAGDLFDGEERRQHAHDLWGEQRAGEHVARRARGHDLPVAEHDRLASRTGPRARRRGSRARPRRRPRRAARSPARARAGTPASMPRVGSSSRSRSAPPTATAAIATRWRWPPERLRGWRSASSDEAERVEPAVDGAVGGPAEQAQRLRDLGPHGRREQHRVRVLRHVRRGRARLDPPGIGREQPGQDPQQRGLARAVAAEQRDDLAAVDLEVDAVQHRPAVERDPERLRAQQQLAGRGPGRSPRRAARAGGPLRPRACVPRGPSAAAGPSPSRRPRRVTLGAPG